MNWPKILISIGFILIATGILFPLISRIPWLGKLPGDIWIRKGNFSFYFPLMTCLIVSLILTVILSLLNKR